MDNYNKLLEELLDKKTKLETRNSDLHKTIESLKYRVTKSEVDINILKKERDYKNYIFDILNNYGKSIGNYIKKYIKIGILSTCALSALFVGGLSIISKVIEATLYTDIIGSIACAAIICGVICTVRFLEDTSHIRAINKDCRYQIDILPSLISGLDKSLEKESNAKLGCEKEIEALILEKNDIKSKLELCKDYVVLLTKKISEVGLVCHKDNDAINEVYSSDEEVEEVIKLVREKNASKID